MNLSQLDQSSNPLLRDLIRERIENEGPLRFSEFMELVLYHPQHGYYVTCDPTLDYQSSPNVHPVFGACLGRQVAAFWRLLGEPAGFTVFEAGAGNYRLAAALLAYLREAEPELSASIRYVVQDVAARPEAASSRLAAAGLPAGRAEVADALPGDGSIEGCILSNELLDALPFERVRVRDGRLLELRVGLADGRLVDVESEPGADLVEHFAALGLLPGEGCDAEVNLEAPRWLERAAASLRRGYVLTLDYGYDAPDLYAAWRKRGTLLTFYRHTAGEDPYARLGRQDITASVDFTTLQRRGEEAGLRTLGSWTQAEFLAASGIGEALAQPPAADQLEAYYALRRAAVELTDPAGLGRIRVLCQGKEVPPALPSGLEAN